MADAAGLKPAELNCSSEFDPRCSYRIKKLANIAQLAEQGFCKAQVMSSTLIVSSYFLTVPYTKWSGGEIFNLEVGVRVPLGSPDE